MNKDREPANLGDFFRVLIWATFVWAGIEFAHLVITQGVPSAQGVEVGHFLGASGAAAVVFGNLINFLGRR